MAGLFLWFYSLNFPIQCDPNCRDGNRTRKVWCETVPEGIVIADSMCDCGSKPAEREVCTNIPGLDECYLIPLWKVGEFSEVSARFSKGR